MFVIPRRRCCAEESLLSFVNVAGKNGAISSEKREAPEARDVKAQHVTGVPGKPRCWLAGVGECWVKKIVSA